MDYFFLQLKPNTKPVYCLHKQDLATSHSNVIAWKVQVFLETSTESHH